MNLQPRALSTMVERARFWATKRAIGSFRTISASRSMSRWSMGLPVRGFSVVREFVGHGVGRTMHEPPQVPNFVDGKSTPILKPGMTIAIEPMVNAGLPGVKILNDD